MSNDINVLKPARPIPIGPGSIYIHRGRQSFPNTELRQSASADNPLLLTQSASADNLLLPKLRGRLPVLVLVETRLELKAFCSFRPALLV